MLFWRTPCFLIVLFWGLVLSVSCRFTPPSEEKAEGDRLIISSHQTPAAINPILTSTTISDSLGNLIFDGLIRLDTQLAARPHLAASWQQSQQGRMWTFRIREGISFHDGKALTAEDVAFTFEAIKSLKGGGRWSYLFREIDEITVQDPYGLQITLKRPMAAFLQAVDFGILPKHLYKGKDLTKLPTNEKLVGSGAYRLKLWSADEIVLEANEDYFLGTPKIDEIQVKIYANQEAVWAKLMAGEVDYFGYHTPGNFAVLQQVPHFHMHTIPNPFYYLVAFNLQDTVFADRRVRQALNYAVDKEAIIDKVLRGRGRAAAGTIYPGSWAHHPTLKPYPYEPNKALALLKAAGWEDHDGDHLLDKEGKPLKITAHVNTGDELKKNTLLLIQQQLQDIGIQMDVQFFNATDIDFLLKNEFQAHFPEIVALPDPDISYIGWHGSQIKGGFNVSSYNNPEVNRLLEEGRTEMGPDKRKVLYFQYQEEMLKDPPGIFLFWADRLVGVHQRFKGVKIGPAGPFANIHEWTVAEAEQRLALSGAVNE